MQVTPNTQTELERLVGCFTALEGSSRVAESAPVDALLVVRADGIKHSKHFLKDSLENPRYRMALHEAVGTTFRLWRNWAPECSRPFLSAILRISDEVSFLVSRGDNYYGRRVLKITTVLASTLSGAMSLELARPGTGSGRPSVAAFDGRPLILGREGELAAYVRCRRLLHARNSMAKVLRLESELTDEELYDEEPRLANDIHRLSLEIGTRSLWPQFERAASGCAVYVAGPDGQLDGRTLPSDPADDRVVRDAIDSACR